MKAFCTLLVFGISIACSPWAHAAEQRGNWSLNFTNETVTGITRKTISTPSINPLQGANKSDTIELVYACKGEFYLLARDIGFAIDDVNCGPYGCKKKQHGKIKFGRATINNIEFEISQSSNDRMFLLHNKAELLKRMKAGNNMALELELSKTNGQEQMATFSLKGFTAAYNWCNK